MASLAAAVAHMHNTFGSELDAVEQHLGLTEEARNRLARTILGWESVNTSRKMYSLAKALADVHREIQCHSQFNEWQVYSNIIANKKISVDHRALCYFLFTMDGLSNYKVVAKKIVTLYSKPDEATIRSISTDFNKMIREYLKKHIPDVWYKAIYKTLRETVASVQGGDENVVVDGTPLKIWTIISENHASENAELIEISGWKRYKKLLNYLINYNESRRLLHITHETVEVNDMPITLDSKDIYLGSNETLIDLVDRLAAHPLKVIKSVEVDALSTLFTQKKYFKLWPRSMIRLLEYDSCQNKMVEANRRRHNLTNDEFNKIFSLTPLDYASRYSRIYETLRGFLSLHVSLAPRFTGIRSMNSDLKQKEILLLRRNSLSNCSTAELLQLLDGIHEDLVDLTSAIGDIILYWEDNPEKITGSKNEREKIYDILFKLHVAQGKMNV